jgi:phosphatidylglycerol---prolipoprotein diacylglyceryl transferase
VALVTAFWRIVVSITSVYVKPEVLTSVALLTALAYAVRSARRSGLDPRAMYWAVTSAIVGGLFGGHLMNLFVHGWQGPYSLLQFWQGGKSWYGGLLGGGLVGGLYFHYRKLPVLAYADAAMPAVALGYSIGRLGCFLNGDDYGTLSSLPWAVAYPPGSEAYLSHLSRGWIGPEAVASLPIHPMQLYASLFGLCLFVFLSAWRPRRDGRRLFSFLILYGVTRFFMEQWFRGDFRAVLGPFSLPQLFSLLLILTGGVLWMRERRREAAKSSVNLDHALYAFDPTSESKGLPAEGADAPHAFAQPQPS